LLNRLVSVRSKPRTFPLFTLNSFVICPASAVAMLRPAEPLLMSRL
jgi:hypothetical protein